MLTNSNLAQLNRLFKSSTIGDLQVSFKTFHAIRKLAQQIEEALKPVAEVEMKYLKDGSEDKEYQDYLKGLNQLRKDQPNDGLAFAKYQQDNEQLIENQRKRTEEFQKLLESEAEVSLKTLKEEDYPDLFAAELSNSEWEILSLVLDVD